MAKKVRLGGQKPVAPRGWQVWGVLASVGLLALFSAQAQAAEAACRGKSTTLLDQLNTSDRVILATVTEKEPLGGFARIAVDTVFKGQEGLSSYGGRPMSVDFDIETPCRLKTEGPPAAGDRFLLIYRDGKSVNRLSGSVFLPNDPLADTAAAWDQLIVVRQLFAQPEQKTQLVAEPELAIRIATKAMVAFFGDKLVRAHAPYSANLKDGIWHVEGVMPCPQGAASCRGRLFVADVNADDAVVRRAAYKD